ncbi:MAG: hypothetical protein QXE51_04025 [Nitrososphaeria archaeon]
MVGAGLGGLLGGLLGGYLSGRTITITSPQGQVIARVLIEPWDFLGVTVERLTKVMGPRQLSISGNIKAILLKADPNNTGRVWLGGSDVGIGNGYPLDGNSTISMQVKNFNDIYLLADSDLEQLVYIVKIGEKA